MPPRASRVCPIPGCAELISGSERYCPEHTRQQQRSVDSRRPSSARRGYDAEWQRIRSEHLRDHPCCVQCAAQGVQRFGRHVDHIVSKRNGGTNDPTNLQTLCDSHHSRKTATYDGGFGNARKSTG
jgi:5-methylcytosine-specific restriction protein A